MAPRTPRITSLDDIPEYKNPREGRSLGEGPDMGAYPDYPDNFPMGADLEVERSIHGKSENFKTFNQCGDYWSERGQNGPWGESEGEPLEEKQRR